MATPGSLEFKPADYEKSTGAFTSMAHDRTRRRGEREGWGKSKVTTDAKTASNTAKDVYKTHWAV